MVACGGCWYCRTGQYSLCDNSNPQPVMTERLWGHAPAGILGYSHAAGGFPGSHAEYIRVPFADVGAFAVPDGVPDEAAVFASDALPTGWMAADMCDLRGGEVVAVWGAGAVGQLAARAAQLLGADRVIVIDRLADRLRLAAEHLGVETLNQDEVDVAEELRERTAGRGPDACIEAVGMEANDAARPGRYDRVKHALRMQTDRPTAVRQAIQACRKGGTVSIVGVFAGFVDKFPLGAAMNKALVLRMGQMHAQRYLPMLLERLADGQIDPGYLATHRDAAGRGRARVRAVRAQAGRVPARGAASMTIRRLRPSTASPPAGAAVDRTRYVLAARDDRPGRRRWEIRWRLTAIRERW